ncbi:TPA: ribosome biogenesis/translation initiation ATPase RLI [Candidatus Woesearchaeota archaeon]|nr:ribosome biogenesis/translation initiation ATPase RLI [Candidatus Woesearchaeota archaeon]HIH32592.1 ribosome biogenesis/translation initiation ATPase RLI [Candidatus Woesearchaeota archaeon]HIH54927.1 ribosome biogenesis/translation initiation ATPase RLI [Candidatus Woesearchaeota archaeon]HIJ01042.1 ribosome biogenesis/translation initiation ATPase RLI [Candidatus Woesearchaeota archaeon]
MTRIAVIDKKKCNPHGCGNYLCAKVCPVNRMGEQCIVEGPDKKALIDEKLCTGCGICPKKCPFGAITIINLPEELDKEPIHRYGVNGFALYNLPTPLFGKVIGIIGRNGIGKSTAMKILSNNLKPNLGREHNAGIKEVIEYFKGTEAQAYFEKLRDDKIIISYKPQQVDLIPKQFNGTVKELLEKVDQKNIFDSIVKELELENLLDSKLHELSGGELQRLAIAATSMKKANVYFFDEPTSYLDIKQRMKISRFIKSLADENTAVMVIEHDLIVLDYMADMIHLMYGHESVYGVVSGLKTTKNGINVYLSGFLKEENVRFRDNAIKFERHAQQKESKPFILTEWEGFEHSLGRFRLNAESGLLSKGDVVGILGQNGIGKTTFVKILAGVIDEKNKLNLRVSYKPQYLEASDELVITALQRAIQKFEIEIIRPLNLKELFMRKISELSGGELQKVAIAHCLSQDADIYLMDEPSAYLDVEQRLIVAKVIRDVMFTTGKSAMIVDHDLLFIDSLSDKLLIFEGIPAVQGLAKSPMSMRDGMNAFLRELNITFRRDEENHRPRINKEDSVKDREQKAEGKLYYS